MADKEERKFTYDYLNTDNKLIMSEEEMADKEERIIIAVAEPSLLEGGADKIYPCMTRQEAIEVMAKALCHRHCPEKVCTSCDEWEKYGTKEDAEAALNALLEGVKK